MRQKKSSVFAFIIALVCIAVYISALLFAAYRIYLSVNERRATAGREFYDLADLSSAAGVLGFMDAPFREALQDRLEGSQTLQGLIISGPNGEYAFERKQGSVIGWVGDSPRFITRFGISRTPYFAPLRIEGLRNVTISAVASYIDYDVLIAVMKRSLLAVLAALAASFITLIIETLRGRNRPDAAGSPPDRDGDLPRPEEIFTPGEAEPPVNFPEEEEPGEEDFPDFSVPEAGEPDFPEEEALLPDFDEVPAEESAGEEKRPPKAPPEKAPPEPAEKSAPPSGPRGLYSPETRIGWEDYTLDRLAAELHRCASFEQDLALLIIQFKESRGPEEELFKELAERAVNYFNLRDLIFERGGRGITVIIPNIDLDQGFSQSEEFHNRVSSSLSSYFSAPTDLCIGLSSRSGRLIDADRLLYEASQALNKALEDPASPIVAFKSDPEKYRSFIAARNRPRP
jgi:hypothetical protein